MANRKNLSSREEAERRISEAIDKGSTSLDLSALDLFDWRENFDKLTNLRRLDLSQNRITAWPENFDKLTNLQSIDLSHNQISAWPENFDKLTNLQSLDLSHNQISAWPDNFDKLTNLQSIDLSHNQISAWPDNFDKLTNLQSIDLSHNQISAWPDNFDKLTNLQSIFLSHNQISAWPDNFDKLTNLQSIFLSDNQINAWPENFDKLTNLQSIFLSDNQINAWPENFDKLTNLQSIFLSYNQISAWPENFDKLTKLQELFLSGNQINTWPDNFDKLAKLQELFLSGNQINAWPENFDKLTKLQKLDLSFNQINRWPENFILSRTIVKLFLQYNNLTFLPQSFQDCKNLGELYLHGNEGLRLPTEVLGPTWQEVNEGATPANPAEILAYYFKLQKGKRPLNEVKLILVGRGGAGKTSLVNRLVDGAFDKNSPETKGIKIRQWNLRLGEEEVRLNIWDFGGQEIMHATHQFFLTERSLYVVVLSAREGQQEEDADYWLKLIASFGGDSPVLVVLNKQHEHPFNVNRNALSGKFPNRIKVFVATDCKSGEGIEELKRELRCELERWRDWRVSFPASWFEIKERLAASESPRGWRRFLRLIPGLGQRRRQRIAANYVSIEAFQALCGEHGERSVSGQKQLASNLHKLGIALNYHDDPRLSDTHILNPHWVTEGIYQILNAKRLDAQKGVLGANELDTILSREAYPGSKPMFILDLMRKFELCFAYPDDSNRYLVPELLDVEQPPEADAFRPEECLGFEYHYPILPHGLIPRFIVRTHVLSEEEKRWRTGVILRMEGCRALVKADIPDKKVTILISGSGSDRRRLLAVIRSDFDRIHRSIKDLKPKEMVPVASKPGLVVEYEELVLLERKTYPACLKRYADELVELNVLELLNGVDLTKAWQKRRDSYIIESSARLFYSYAHEDEPLRNQLETHLKILEQRKLIFQWHDRMIPAGGKWAGEINVNLEQADVILLLVSADFMASEYCQGIELKRALERESNGSAIVIPIILRMSNLKGSKFSHLNYLPADGKPVTSWSDRDEAWTNVSEGIENAINFWKQNTRVRY